MRIFKKGDPVRLIQPVIEGTIVGGVLSESGDGIDYKIVTKINGELIERHFDSEQLEIIQDSESISKIKALYDEHQQQCKDNSKAEESFAAIHDAEAK